MWKYAAIISYEGTGFCGWQKQKKSGAQGHISIQESIEETLFKMTGDFVSVVGSGRTDAGVHALQQVMHFIIRPKEWDCGILRKGLNSLLPKRIRVLEVRRVPIEFHAQRSATRKQYSYYFQQGSSSLPHLAPYSLWIQRPLDVEGMNRAIATLRGEHDFKPFQASGAKPIPTVRTILEADVTSVPVGFPLGAGGVFSDIRLVRVRVLGTGFLKQMVRGIAGTLLQVGDGRRAPECMEEILRTLDRKLVGPTAPARGLWLERVWYPEFD